MLGRRLTLLLERDDVEDAEAPRPLPEKSGWSGTVALGCGDELPELVDLLFAELDLEAVLAGDLLLAVIADRVGI